MVKTYQEKKEEIRREAIAWQESFRNNDYSYGALIVAQTYFEEMGKRYGLLQEFKENGIC